MSPEGARVTVGLAAALGEAGEGLRRPGTESKLFSPYQMAKKNCKFKSESLGLDT